MKKFLIVLILLAAALRMPAQATYGALIYSGGKWVPAASTSTTNPLATVLPIHLYCYSSGVNAWVPADSSCFSGTGSGTVNAGTTAQLAYYPANGTAVSGTSTPTPGNIALGAYEPNIPIAAMLQKTLAGATTVAAVTIAYEGDSITTNSWPQIVTDKLASVFGGQTGTIYPFFKGYGVLSGTAWTPVPNVGIYQASTVTSVQKGASGSVYTFPAFSALADTATLYFYTFTDSTNVTWTVDGSGAGTCTVGTSASFTASSCSISIANSFSGHTISITASGPFYLWGGGFSLGSSGIRYVNLAVGGTLCEAYSTDTSWLGFLPANTILLDACGANDGWVAAQTIAAKSAIFNGDGTHPGTKALGIPEAQVITNPGTVQNSAQDASVTAVTAWAQSQGMPVASIWNEWGTYTLANALGFMGDTVHPNGTGAADFARLVLRDIFGGVIPNPAYGTWLTNGQGAGTAGFHIPNPNGIFLIDGPYQPDFKLCSTAPSSPTDCWSSFVGQTGGVAHSITGVETFSASQFTFSTTGNNAFAVNSAAGNSMNLQLQSDHYASITLKNTASPFGSYVDYFFNNADAWLVGMLNTNSLQFIDRANSVTVVSLPLGMPASSITGDASGPILSKVRTPAARKGTFVCTAGGTITISNTNGAATSDVVISLNAQGGTITTPPAMKTVTAGTGFTVLCGASDTSTYNYTILN